MKYVMLETEEGQKLPFTFPDAIVHQLAAQVATMLVEVSMNTKSSVVSAGFVRFGPDTTTFGESESLGGLLSKPTDAAFMVGDTAVAFMPDGIAATQETAMTDKKHHYVLIQSGQVRADTFIPHTHPMPAAEAQRRLDPLRVQFPDSAIYLRLGTETTVPVTMHTVRVVA